MSSPADSTPATAESWQLGDHALLERISLHEKNLRQTEAAQLADLAEVESRGLHIGLGFRSVADLLCTQVTVSRFEAKKRMQRARALRSGTYSYVAEALATGEIGGAHLDELVRFHDKLSPAVTTRAVGGI